MSDPRRLRESSANPVARDLLARGRLDEPPADAHVRALAALGVPSLGAAPPHASAPAAGAMKGAGLVAALKWGGALVLGGGLAVGALIAAQHSVSHQPRDLPPSTASSTSAMPTLQTVGPAPVAPPVASQAAPPVSATTSATAMASIAPRRPPPSAAASARTARPSDVQETPSIAAELAALDGARRAYLGGDPRRALAELDAFDARFPRSQLADEAVALRIEALDAAGLRAPARDLAAQFLGAHSDSPYADSVRRVITKSPAP